MIVLKWFHSIRCFSLHKFNQWLTTRLHIWYDYISSTQLGLFFIDGGRIAGRYWLLSPKRNLRCQIKFTFVLFFFLILLSLPWFSFYSFGIWCKEWVIGHLNLGVVRQIIEFSNIFSSLLLTFSHTRAASVAWNGSENHRRSCSLSDQRQS